MKFALGRRGMPAEAGEAPRVSAACPAPPAPASRPARCIPRVKIGFPDRILAMLDAKRAQAQQLLDRFPAHERSRIRLELLIEVRARVIQMRLGR